MEQRKGNKIHLVTLLILLLAYQIFPIYIAITGRAGQRRVGLQVLLQEMKERAQAHQRDRRQLQNLLILVQVQSQEGTKINDNVNATFFKMLIVTYLMPLFTYAVN